MAKIKKTTKVKKAPKKESKKEVKKDNLVKKEKKPNIFKRLKNPFGKKIKKSKKSKNTDDLLQEKKAPDYKLESSKVYKGFMFGFMLFGLLWLLIAYISNGALLNFGNWNLLVGFAFILTGFFMTTGWK